MYVLKRLGADPGEGEPNSSPCIHMFMTEGRADNRHTSTPGRAGTRNALHRLRLGRYIFSSSTWGGESRA